jgi:hypothetical protein
LALSASLSGAELLALPSGDVRADDASVAVAAGGFASSEGGAEVFGSAVATGCVRS